MEDCYYLDGSGEWCHPRQTIFTAFYPPLVLYSFVLPNPVLLWTVHCQVVTLAHKQQMNIESDHKDVFFIPQLQWHLCMQQQGKRKLLTFWIWEMENFERESWRRGKPDIHLDRYICWNGCNNFKKRKSLNTCYAVISLQNHKIFVIHSTLNKGAKTNVTLSALSFYFLPWYNFSKEF